MEQGPSDVAPRGRAHDGAAAGDVARSAGGSRHAGSARDRAEGFAAWRDRLSLPTLCPACRRWPAVDVATVTGLCGGCLQVTGVEPAALAAAGAGRAFRRVSAAVRYESPWDGWVRRLKFADGLSLASPMAALAARAWRDGCDDHDLPPTLVVPVPLSPDRLRQRGYNQAWELARRIARSIGVASLPDALLRLRDTRAQAELGLLERRANLEGAFAGEPARADRLRGARVLLVDDVITTGATLDAAARALRDAGAVDVEACAFALTPPPGAGAGR